MLISSAEMQPVLMAISLVLQKVAEDPEKQSDDASLEGRFSLPAGSVDVVNGEGGAELGSIMERTSCEITIADSTFDNTSGAKDHEERVMTVKGTLEMILHAVGQVLNLVATAPSPGTDGRM